MGVSDGQRVNAATTNPAFLDANTDDTALGKIDFANTDPPSGPTVTNIQREVNSLDSFTGRPAGSVYNVKPTWTNNDVGSSTDDVKTRADAITAKFSATTGHKHSGAAGDAPKIDLTADVSGVLPIGNGGTGQSTQTTAFDALSPTTTKGDLIARTTANNVRLPVGTDGQALVADSTQTAGVKWATPSTDVSTATGTLAIAHGGTGQTTKTDAFDALAPTTTKGDLPVYNGTDNVRQAVGTDGQVLTADSTQSTGIKWANPTGGGGGINFFSTSDIDAESSVFNWIAYNDTQTVTITNATPAVFTVGSTTGYYNGMQILFSTSGSLPTGLTAGTTYYISNLGTDGAGKFRVSASLGGAEVNTSSAGSGTHTARPMIPTTGSGGSANVTIAQTTTGGEVIRGVGSFKGVKDANNRAGEGWSCLVTIPTGYSNYPRNLISKFAYMVSANFLYNSGTFTSPGDVMVYWRDVTNNTLVEPDTLSLDGSGQYIGQVQFNKSVTSIRICLHIPTTNASAWNLFWDDNSIGPDQSILGPGTPIFTAYRTAAVSHTSSANDQKFPYNLISVDSHGGFDTTNNRYVAQIAGRYEIGGAVNFVANATGYRSLTLYKNGVIEKPLDTRAGCTLNGSTACGVMGPVEVDLNVGDYVELFAFQNSGGTLAYQDLTLVSTFMQGALIRESISPGGNAGVPLAAFYSVLSSTTITNGTALKFTTRQFDSSSGYNTSTGEYTVAVSGLYKIAVSGVSTTGATIDLDLFVNGSQRHATFGTLVNAGRFGAVVEASLLAGDLVKVVPTSSGTAGNTAGYFSIDRISTPSSSSVGRIVAFTATHTNAAVTTEVTVPFSSGEVAIDTNGSYDSVAGLWRCQVSGVHRVEAHTSTAAVNSNTVRWLYKLNGGASTILVSCLSNTNGSFVFNGAVLLNLKVGDTIEYRVSSASSQSLDTTAIITKL